MVKLRALGTLYRRVAQVRMRSRLEMALGKRPAREECIKEGTQPEDEEHVGDRPQQQETEPGRVTKTFPGEVPKSRQD